VHQKTKGFASVGRSQDTGYKPLQNNKSNIFKSRLQRDSQVLIQTPRVNKSSVPETVNYSSEDEVIEIKKPRGRQGFLAE